MTVAVYNVGEVSVVGSLSRVQRQEDAHVGSKDRGCRDRNGSWPRAKSVRTPGLS